MYVQSLKWGGGRGRVNFLHAVQCVSSGGEELAIDFIWPNTTDRWNFSILQSLNNSLHLSSHMPINTDIKIIINSTETLSRYLNKDSLRKKEKDV